MGCPHRFQLKSWVVLRGCQHGPEPARIGPAFRGPIAVQSLSEHSGVELPQLVALLSLPQVQAALRCSPQAVDVSRPQGTTDTTTAAAASITRQWVQKLTGWITRGGRS